MFRRNKKSLARDLENKIEEWSRKSLETGDDIEEAARKIEAYSKILTGLRAVRRDGLITMGVVASVVLTVGFLIFVTPITIIKNVDIYGNVTASGFNISSTKMLNYQPPKPVRLKRISLDSDRLAIRTSPALRVTSQKEDSIGWMDLKSDQIRMIKFQIAPMMGDDGTNQSILYQLQVQAFESGLLSMSVKRAHLKLISSVWGNTSVSAGNDVSTVHRVNEKIDVAETLEVDSGSTNNPPTTISIWPVTLWSIRNLEGQDLGFARETPTGPGESEFISTLIKGTIRLPDINRDFTLREGDELILENNRGKVLTADMGKSIDLTFSGTARAIFLGPKGHRRNLAPSILEYVYHNQPLGLFWGALAFLWGVAWGFRKILDY